MTSLLQQPSAIPIRPMSDKEMEVVDLDQLFEKYVETDLLGRYNDSTAGRSSSDGLAHLFESSSSNESELFGSGSMLDREAEAAWHKAEEKCKQNPASYAALDSSSFCLDSRGKGSLSDSELLNFEDLFELECNQLRSRSQPSTPRPHSTKSVKKAVSFNNRSIAGGIQKSTGKSPAKEFAKMMQPSHYRASMPDVWTRRMDTPADSLYLRAPSNGITSPPLPSKTRHENGNGFFAQDHQPYGLSRSPLRSNDSHAVSDQDFVNYQLTPQASPGIGFSRGDGAVEFSDTLGMPFGSSVSSAALSALQTPPSSLHLLMTTWGPDTSPGLEFTFSASPDYSGASKTAGWWNDDVPTQPTLYRESASRPTSQNLAVTTGAMNGLGISCDSAPFGNFNAVMGGSVAEDLRGASASSFDMGPYTAMHPTPPTHHMVPIGHRPLSRTPSPCPQPRFHRRRPSSHSHPSQAHHRAPSSRRKSSTNPTSQTLSRQSSSGNVGFVNFTPDDSRKILTGVAPSGSSKTKARREKEAADKRRKLSQAAMKAVIEAGGDVDSLKRLEREGLLVLES